MKSHQFEEKCPFLTPQKLQVFIRLPLFPHIRKIFVREKGFFERKENKGERATAVRIGDSCPRQDAEKNAISKED